MTSIKKPMTATLKQLRKKEACITGLNWIIANYPGIGETDPIGVEILDKGIDISYVRWWLARTKAGRLVLARLMVIYARRVVPIYEAEYPTRRRLRRTVEDLEAWVKNPTTGRDSAKVTRMRQLADAAKLEVIKHSSNRIGDDEHIAAWHAACSVWLSAAAIYGPVGKVYDSVDSFWHAARAVAFASSDGTPWTSVLAKEYEWQREELQRLIAEA